MGKRYSEAILKNKDAQTDQSLRKCKLKQQAASLKSQRMMKLQKFHAWLMGTRGRYLHTLLIEMCTVMDFGFLGVFWEKKSQQQLLKVKIHIFVNLASLISEKLKEKHQELIYVPGYLLQLGKNWERMNAYQQGNGD